MKRREANNNDVEDDNDSNGDNEEEEYERENDKANSKLESFDPLPLDDNVLHRMIMLIMRMSVTHLTTVQNFIMMIIIIQYVQ